MYWYYKAFLVSFVGVIIWGLFSLISPYLNISAVLSSKDEVEKVDPIDSAGTSTSSPALVRSTNSISKHQLTASQNSKLQQAKELFEKY